MPYSLAILWRERHRFLPAVLAVAFSALLIALQCALLLGLLATSSRPIDRTRADLWVSSQGVQSIGFSQPIPQSWEDRLAVQPEVDRIEPFLCGFGNWHKPGGGMELCYVLGSRLEEGSLGALSNLTPAMRAGLTEPGAVVVDHSDLGHLGLDERVGQRAEMSGRRVRVVGLLRGMASPGMMPVVLCSLRTARLLLPGLRDLPGQTMYLLARCRRPGDAALVVHRLRAEYPDMAVFTSREFSLRTRMHWLTATKAGIALGFAALLGLFVGAVVTSQTLYAATAASLREYAVLRALGIPRRRMARLVLAQSFWIGVGGVALALPLVLGLGQMAHHINLEMALSGWLLAATGVVTFGMALGSGLAALRSLRLADPIVLLR